MGGSNDNSSPANRGCSVNGILVFLAALAGGTLSSLTSKIMLTMKGRGLTGELESFSTPLFQSFSMFLGMASVLLLHILTNTFKWNFPGYNHENPVKIPLKMYFLLLAPTIFDLVSTVLAMFGLKYINVSIYQMLRGSSIIFVAIMKQFVFGHHLPTYKWIGIFYNVISIILVGVTALLSAGDTSSAEASSEDNNPLLGVSLILCGAFVQSLQYVYEERMMTASDDLPAAPPLLIVGMEGLWGTLICLFVLYPIAFSIKGNDHGSIENLWNSLTILYNTPAIQIMFVLYFISILLLNIFALLVTFMLDSVWRAILDNFRPISVWIFDLTIFYFVTRSYGEAWTIYSWIQLLGLFILFYGTAIYNAPNPGSIKLIGDANSCYIDCSDEYDDVEHDINKGDISYSNVVSPMILMSPAAQDRRNPVSRREVRQRENEDQPYRQQELRPLVVGGGRGGSSNTGNKDYGSGV
jgi:drug/metabolite transporter (DMT)-like permease